MLKLKIKGIQQYLHQKIKVGLFQRKYKLAEKVMIITAFFLFIMITMTFGIVGGTSLFHYYMDMEMDVQITSTHIAMSVKDAINNKNKPNWRAICEEASKDSGVRAQVSKNDTIIYDGFIEAQRPRRIFDAEDMKKMIDTMPPPIGYYLPGNGIRIVKGTSKESIVFVQFLKIEYMGEEYEVCVAKATGPQYMGYLSMFYPLSGFMLAFFIFSMFLYYQYCQRFLFSPIRKIIEEADLFDGDTSGHRLTDPGTKDELSMMVDALNKGMDRIEKSNEKQKQFVADASHELRTPITVIIGYTDTLMRWGKSEKDVLDESLESIMEEAKNMKALVEKLLFLAHEENKTVQKELINLGQVLSDVVKESISIYPDRNILFPRQVPALAWADATLMKEFFRIFIDNGAKYTHEGGMINVWSDISEDEKYFDVAIEDNGIGIAADEIDKVFDRFYRSDKSRTKSAGQSGGMGLGLSIAKIIAEKHGISVRVESELGKGTIIFLEIPLATYTEKT